MLFFFAQEEALFHGDPHAGNVFHVSNDPNDPYRIALLDWGLMGRLPRQQRAQLLQLMLGAYLRNAKRLRNHVGALIEGGRPKSSEKLRRIHFIVEEILKRKKNRTIFDTLSELMVNLAREGYHVRFNISLFIKSQVTIAGIMYELDPQFKQDAYTMKRTSNLVWKESPKHFLYTIWFPAWNSHNYPSMLSNEDVKDITVKKFGRFLKSVGKGIAKIFR